MKRTMMAVMAVAAVPAALAAQQPQQQDTTRRQGDSSIVVDSSMVVDSAQALQGTTPGRRVNQMNEAGDTTRSELRDSLLRANNAPQSAAQQGQTMGQRSGRNVRGAANLTRAQVVQLQEALNANGCDAGTADGIMGAKTRRAIQCAQQQLGVSDEQALYQALNLDFAQDAGSSTQDTSTSSDSTVGTPTVPMTDSTAGNRARQQGLPDSTMTRPDSTTLPDSSALQGTTPGRRVNQMNEAGDTTSSALRDSLLRANTGTQPTTPTARDTTRRTPPQI